MPCVLMYMVAMSAMIFLNSSSIWMNLSKETPPRFKVIVAGGVGITGSGSGVTSSMMAPGLGTERDADNGK